MTGTSEEQHVNIAKVYAFAHLFKLLHSDPVLAVYYIENETSWWLSVVLQL
jgi:hypothetical protein